MNLMADHPLNRHLFIADNINLLRSLDNETIDLICIDPPFAKNQTFIGNLRPALSDEERQQEIATLESWGIYNRMDAERAGIDWPDADNTGRFQDIWRWENDVHEEWVNRIEGDYLELANVINAARGAHGESMAAYLTYMAIRFIEMHRILKQTGSVYIHCDSVANSYLRTVLDSIFGERNFRNEIAWARSSGFKRRTANKFTQKTDTILSYSKSNSSIHFNTQYKAHKPEYIKRFKKDENGRLYRDDVNPTRGGRRVIYLDETEGDVVDSLWDDINPVNPNARERTGYPTQKPVALAERIILASSNPGDVVLDCFAGCAYVPVAAERNGRQWIACDISPRALTVLRRQFAKFNYAVDGAQQTEQPLLMVEADITTKGPGELPERSDEDPEERQEIRELPPRRFKVPASLIPEAEMLERLLELSGYMAWCCGYANRMPDGSIIRTMRNFHLDHIDPKSKQGSNDIQNRAPLCPYHNTRKNNRRVHLADYRAEIADAGEMMVNTTSELIDLAQAQHESMQIYGRAYAEQYSQV